MQTALKRHLSRQTLSNGSIINKNGAPHGIRWSVDEYYKMYDLGLFMGRRVELIKGKIFEMSPMLSPHATSIRLVYELLRKIFQKGFEIRVQMPISLGKISEPEPDVAVVAGAIRDYSDHHPTAATLLVEVALTSVRFDRTTKLKLYAENGIEEYWIVNLKQRHLEVFRKPILDGDAADYAEKLIVTEEEFVYPLERPNSRLKVANMLP